MSALLLPRLTPRAAVSIGSREIQIRSREFLAYALGVAACAHLATITAARIASVVFHRTPFEIRGTVIPIVRGYEIIPVPPVEHVTRGTRSAAATNATPVPVSNDAQADVTGVGLPTTPASDGAGPVGDDAAPDVPAPAIVTPNPDSFVYFQDPPERVSMPIPAYPELAREAGVEGTVVVQALIGLDGRIRETRIRRSIAMLNDAAVAAVRASQWRPARDNNRPVMVWVEIPVNFNLR